MNVENIAKLIDGEVFGQKNIKINGFNSIETAKIDEVSFAFSTKEIEKINISLSKIIITPPIFFLNSDKTFIFTEKTLDEVLYILTKNFKENDFNKKEIKDFRGKNVQISSESIIEKNVHIGNNTIIKAGVVLEENVFIGDDVIIYPNVVIKEGSILGNKVVIDSGACIGAESFWGVKINGKNEQIYGLKGVKIEDNVYIGANSTIEKGVLRATTIKENTNIGSLVTIAHDSIIGKNNRLVSQTGIASRCTLGNNNILYGQVGVANDINIGNDVIIYAKSGIKDDILDGEKISGIPAMKHKDNIKMIIKQRREFYKNGHRK